MLRISRRSLCLIAFALSLSSCQRSGASSEQTRVSAAFEAWKSAVVHDQPDLAMAYLPSHVDDYLATLNSPESPSTPVTPASPSPGVDHLLRTALEKKVPVELRTKLTLATLLRRITDEHLFNPKDVRQITLGRVSVNGTHASAEVYFDGTLTALHLPFTKESDGWKIDVLAVRPYAEILLRLDRAVKGETEAQQVDQLVARLPAL